MATSMSESQEIAFITESNCPSGCVSAWNFQSGVQYKNYKGGHCAKHGFAITDHYLLAAQPGQALIHVWSLSKDQLHMKIACPGKLTALACSYDSLYCVAAIQEKIYIWQLSTGNLLSVLSRHYQTIRCIRFVDDCSHFITGGDDGLVIVWRLADLIDIGSQFDSGNRLKSPRYVWSNHSLPITSIFTGLGGHQCHIVTASKDQTCKVWNLADGQLLCSFVFNSIVSSVTMDSIEANMYVGTSKGKIYRIDLYSSFTGIEQHIDDDDCQVIDGHSDTINGLSTSMDGNLLLSASEDCTVKLWHTSSLQCIKMNQFKGAITNLFFIIAPHAVTKPKDSSKQCLPPLKPFKRYLYDANATVDVNMSTIQGMKLSAQDRVDILLHGSYRSDRNIHHVKEFSSGPSVETNKLERQIVDEAMEAINRKHEGDKSDNETTANSLQLQEDISKLRHINKNFYLYAINELFERS